MKLDNDKYFEVKEALLNFQKEQKMEILIAALGGSRSIGTHNAFSDFDVYVIYRHQENKIFPRKMHCYTANMYEIHIVSCSEQEIICELQNYTTSTHIYPSYLNRTEEEMTMNHNLTMYERSEYPRTLVFYTLMADVIWTFQTPLPQIYQKFWRGLAILDVLDFYYTKAYGNYEHFLLSQETVLARKYITIVQQVLYCRWMCEKKTIPPMDIRKLREEYKADIPYKIGQEIETIYQINKSASEDKFKKYVPVSDYLNQYIFGWLQMIRQNFSELEGIYFELL